MKQPNVGAAIFDDVASLMYNLIDAKRHWKTYLDHTKLIPVASAGPIASNQSSDHKPSTSGIDFFEFSLPICVCFYASVIIYLGMYWISVSSWPDIRTVFYYPVPCLAMANMLNAAGYHNLLTYLLM